MAEILGPFSASISDSPNLYGEISNFVSLGSRRWLL